MKEGQLTGSIIRAFYDTYNILGDGFMEKVYERSLLITLKKHGLQCVSQSPIEFFFDGCIVGSYFADIIVENKVILELKSSEHLHEMHEIQLVNYLKATRIEVGLLFNFGPKPEFRRKILETKYKIRVNPLHPSNPCSY